MMLTRLQMGLGQHEGVAALGAGDGRGLCVVFQGILASMTQTVKVPLFF